MCCTPLTALRSLETRRASLIRLSPSTTGELLSLYSRRCSADDGACSMGLVQDAAVLAASGYSKTSGALTLIAKLGGETENLVCTSSLTLSGSQ